MTGDKGTNVGWLHPPDNWAWQREREERGGREGGKGWLPGDWQDEKNKK
jgi:hypothetical protein